MKIYNTMSRQKEEFKPLEPNKIKLYSCGPTVYDYFHIGNARTFMFFDMLWRYFEFSGYEVIYVQNITDIDDKIIAKSLEAGVTFGEIADRYSRAFLEDSARLGLRKPTHQPRATEVMPEIIALIDALVQRGYAYETGGDVYFRQQALPEYGSLSGKKVDEQKTGARVEENSAKEHPADFTLWKKSKAGEPIWDSPWGLGRPGWHSECVVMSQKYLGETFDIHGGGVDLVFPHHENELAQAKAITGKPLANYWMHSGFLNIEGEKMSKSLKNFFTARDILDQYDAEVIRFFFLSKHYRSPIDFNRELIEESGRALRNIYQVLRAMDYQNYLDAEPQHLDEGVVARFKEAMDDDFNTAKAIALFFELNTLIKASQDKDEKRKYADTIVHLGKALGFFQDLAKHLSTDHDQLSTALIELVISYRQQARADKNWALSDKYRDDLKALGVALKDTPGGCQWSIET